MWVYIVIYHPTGEHSMINKDLRIAVICGGASSEREVSLRSGKAVYGALCSAGYKNTVLFDLTKESMGELLSTPIDVAFLALHGKGGEDGCIQGMLELAGIPYTGSGVESSACCMDKIRTKELLVAANIPTASFIKLSKDQCQDRAAAAKLIAESIGLPAVLKSPCEGSSIGVYIAKNICEIEKYMDGVFSYGDELLAEAFLDGTEITLPILGNRELKILPPVEITSENEFYDFDAKYTQGMCHHIIPARISDGDLNKVREIGERAYKQLGCRGISRIDFIIDKEKGPMVIEINTLPGMTEMSLFPDSARYAGISFSELCERIIAYALEKK